MSTNKTNTQRKRKIKLHGEPPAKKRKVDHELKIDTLVDLMPEFEPLKRGLVPSVLYGPLQKLITEAKHTIQPENAEMENRKNNLEKLHKTINTIKREERAESKVKNYKGQIHCHQVLSKKTTIQKAQVNRIWKDLLFLILPYERKVKYLFSHRSVCRAWNEAIQPHLNLELMKNYVKDIYSHRYGLDAFSVITTGYEKQIHYAFAYLNIMVPDEVGKDYRLFHKKMKQIKEKKHTLGEIILIYLKYIMPHLSKYYKDIPMGIYFANSEKEVEMETLEQLKKPWLKNVACTIKVSKDRDDIKKQIESISSHIIVQTYWRNFE